ncbi:DUF6160 family protein [Acinetobacter sp. ANC 3832]|uniref:putative pilus system protein FilA n=1 Tax=Acinetobacter sp. ANC 3832 TaxID=1977874 RepID=UPI000A353F20|nr:DUF6160 family protein [Acinetobacter sp. ANC 3832]OTG96445.1 pilus assembly protein FilA [Acinetobacter sp. ANC 3832]
MKLFSKIALVSAMAVSANAMAMQAMDDADLSATTGQDGISIGIGISKVDIDKVHVFDGDGLAAAGAAGQAGFGGTATVGAITLNDVVVTANTSSLLASHNLADLSIDTDSGAGKPFLNVAAAVSGLNIDLGKIEVNDASGTGGAYVVGANSAEILSGLSLKTGKMTANIQLGNTPQGAMIKLAGAMVGGLQINDLAIKDASTGGGGYIVLGGIKLNDTGSADLSLDADVAVTPQGLAITAMKGAAGTDIYITKVQLGGGTGYVPKAGATPAVPGTGVGTGSIGDVAISGMKVFNGTGGATGAVITISGH